MTSNEFLDRFRGVHQLGSTAGVAQCNRSPRAADVASPGGSGVSREQRFMHMNARKILLLPPRNPGARKVALDNVRRLNAAVDVGCGGHWPSPGGTSLGEVSVAYLFSPLRQARLLHRLSLDEVASAVGASGSHVSRLERGFAVLSPDLARRFSTLYKIKIQPSPVATPSRARRTTLTQSRRPGRRP